VDEAASLLLGLEHAVDLVIHQDGVYESSGLIEVCAFHPPRSVIHACSSTKGQERKG
jgi:hypothetical protein